jgi:predicted  nucleic acid-binding Zn-ribbon protein
MSEEKVTVNNVRESTLRSKGKVMADLSSLNQQMEKADEQMHSFASGIDSLRKQRGRMDLQAAGLVGRLSSLNEVLDGIEPGLSQVPCIEVPPGDIVEMKDGKPVVPEQEKSA